MCSGRIAIYLGKEYKAGRNNGRITLYSSDEEDLERGFAPNQFSTAYTLEVDPSQVEGYYSRSMVCTHCNDMFYIIAEYGDEYTLYSGPKPYPLEKLGFLQASKGEYVKKVAKSDVTDVRYLDEPLL